MRFVFSLLIGLIAAAAVLVIVGPGTSYAVMKTYEFNRYDVYAAVFHGTVAFLAMLLLYPRCERQAATHTEPPGERSE